MKNLRRILCACLLTMPPLILRAQTPAIESQGPSVSQLSSDESVLNADLLYKLLVAEFDIQRQHWQGAYLNLLSAAQQTRDPRLAQRAVSAAFAGRIPNEALSAASLWLQLSPQSREATQVYLELAILSNHLDDIESILASQLQLTPANEIGMLILQIGQLLSKIKDKQTILNLASKLFTPYMQYEQAHLAMSQAAFNLGDRNRSAQEAEAALAIKPDSELAVLSLAQAQSSSDLAMRTLESFLKKNPTASQVRLAYGRFLIEKKQYEPALEIFKDLEKSQPDNPEILYSLGVLNYQTNHIVAAQEFFERYLGVTVDLPDAARKSVPIYLALSQFSKDVGKLDEALSWLNKINQGDADAQAWQEAQLRRAMIVLQKGRPNDALAIVDSIKSDIPKDDVQRIVVKGQILLEAKRLSDAYDVLAAGIKHYPDNTDLLYEQALVAERLKRYGIMESILRQLLVRSPDNYQALNALGYSFLERGIRLPEGQKLIEKAHALAPKDPYVLDSLGWLHFQIGKYDSAVTFLQASYQLLPESEVAIHLVQALHKVGKTNDAHKILRDAEEKDPENKNLKRLGKRLFADE